MLLRPLLLVSIAALGCGRVSFAPLEDAGAGSDGDAAADANLTCTMRTALPVPMDGAISGTLGATSTTAGTCGGNAAEDVYQIDIPVDGSDLLFAVDGSMTSDDTIAAYIRRGCDDAATELECDLTDGIARQPELRLQGLAAGRYYGFVDGLVAAPYSGTFQVLLPLGAACEVGNERERCGASLKCVSNQCIPGPCGIANVFTGSGPFTFTATTSTEENDHAGSCGGANDGGLRAPDVIYMVNLSSAVSNMVIDTALAGTTYDTLVYVRSADCHGPEVACDDDGGASNTAVVNTGPLPVGTYFIFIDGFGRGSGDAQVEITLVP